MKKKITIVSLSFIGAAILWFICLIASQLFFDGNVFDKGISAFIWRFLIILLIVGFSGILLLTSVSIYEDNKTLAYVSGAMILLTALFALLFFIIGKYEKGFLSYCTLDLVIVSLLVNQITDMQEVLMIGDRKHDVLGSGKFGISCVGVLYGYGSREELETCGAKWIVDTVEDLEAFLERI